MPGPKTIGGLVGLLWVLVYAGPLSALQGPPEVWARTVQDSMTLDPYASCWGPPGEELCWDDIRVFVAMDSMDLVEVTVPLGDGVSLGFEREPDFVQVEWREVGAADVEVVRSEGDLPVPRQPGEYVFRIIPAWPEGDIVTALRVRVAERD